MGRFTDPAFRFLSNTCRLNVRGITEKTSKKIRLRWSLFLTSQERQILLSFLKWKTDHKGADGSWANACRQGMEASGQSVTQEQVLKAREDALAKLGYEWDGMKSRPRQVYREANDRFRALMTEIIEEYGQGGVREEALTQAREEAEAASLHVLELEESLETRSAAMQGLTAEVEDLRASVLNSFDFTPEGLERLQTVLSGQMKTLVDERQRLATDRPRLEKEIERLKTEADACGRDLSQARSAEQRARAALATRAQSEDATADELVELAQAIQTAVQIQAQMTREIELRRPTIRQFTERLEVSLPRLNWLDHQTNLTQEWLSLVGRTRERLSVVRLPQAVSESADLPTYLPAEALPVATPQSQPA